MKNLFEEHEWSVIEKGFDPERHMSAESIFSIGNGYMGQRANFEEKYSGETLQGNYIGGIYYPDKTRVGWWKNGYPEYFAKVLNAVNWVGLNVNVEGEELDLKHIAVSDFTRELDMRRGQLTRSFVAEFSKNRKLKVEAKRFISLVNKEVGAISYTITALNFAGNIKLTPYIDFDVRNKDANYDEVFWEEVATKIDGEYPVVACKTRKTNFHVAAAMVNKFTSSKGTFHSTVNQLSRKKYVAFEHSFKIAEGEAITLEKTVAVTTSMHHDAADIITAANAILTNVKDASYIDLFEPHRLAWVEKWRNSDILIEGDIAAQQGIRFNIFQLNQTYTGEDPRLNIGPKGFTGEKYGGSTYWDTEAYCLPFYLCTSTQEVGRSLLKYRHDQLQKAIENAAKLGFTNGAALYPMVTMNGEECHNEWEITFEEIHRNGAIAYAIHKYIRFTGDDKYLADYGLDVLIGIARFWSQRITYSESRKKYVMLGVTGPNEYENNVNNNWYTNYIACWCMQYCMQAFNMVAEQDQSRYEAIIAATNFDFIKETSRWTDIIQNMHYPTLEGTNLLLQQDGFMDKEQILVADLDPKDRPLNQKWSWDRILRSVFIKQADVLQGIYFFEDEFDTATIQENFDFYEPRTVHESSLSPSVHVILAARLNDQERAYKLYLRTARLDLDDYNHEAEEGLHITSMAGTWLSVVEGFGGLRVHDGVPFFSPFLPGNWKSFSFKIVFRGRVLQLTASANDATLSLVSGDSLKVGLFDKTYMLSAEEPINVSR